MLHIANNRSVLAAVTHQCFQIRWTRKPFWLPIAKTKLFRVEQHNFDPVETLEIRRLYRNYKTHLRAIRHHLVEDLIETNESLINKASEKSRQEEEVEILECFAINDEWNKQIAEERIKYRSEVQEKRGKNIERIKARIDKTREYCQKVDKEAFMSKKKITESNITSDTLDEAIERCFETKVDFNYAIDLEGKRYIDSTTNKTSFDKDSEKILTVTN